MGSAQGGSAASKPAGLGTSTSTLGVLLAFSDGPAVPSMGARHALSRPVPRRVWRCRHGVIRRSRAVREQRLHFRAERRAEGCHGYDSRCGIAIPTPRTACAVRRYATLVCGKPRAVALGPRIPAGLLRGSSNQPPRWLARASARMCARTRVRSRSVRPGWAALYLRARGCVWRDARAAMRQCGRLRCSAAPVAQPPECGTAWYSIRCGIPMHTVLHACDMAQNRAEPALSMHHWVSAWFVRRLLSSRSGCAHNGCRCVITAAGTAVFSRHSAWTDEPPAKCSLALLSTRALAAAPQYSITCMCSSVHL